MSTAECSCQLLACCEQDLETSLFQNTPEIASKNEAEILTATKALAVVDVATTVRVTELLTTRQEHGEGVRAWEGVGRPIYVPSTKNAPEELP